MKQPRGSSVVKATECGKAHLYATPPGTPLPKAVADAVVAGHLPRENGPRPGPLDLARITLFVPDMRLARALKEAFLEASGGRAALLPRLRPLLPEEEDAGALLAALAAGDAPSTELPPVIDRRDQRLVLTDLVLRWARAERKRAGTAPETSADAFVRAGLASTPAQAAHLAAEISRLSEDAALWRADIATLAEAVPQEFLDQWGHTLDLLQPIISGWEEWLAARGAISTARAFDLFVSANARRFAAHPPAGPILAVGFRESPPAVAELLRAILAAPQGAIVLEDVDFALEQEAWEEIAPGHPEHPQFAVKTLLTALGRRREDVSPLPLTRTEPWQTARAAFVSEALRPASTVHTWSSRALRGGSQASAAFTGGLCLIEAASAEEEAEAAALILREALETLGQTAALITPDRQLMRRVSARLATWGLDAGRPPQPFSATETGSVLCLVADAVETHFAPISLMALLHHPRVRLGLDPIMVRRAARALELAAFRVPYTGTGLTDVKEALTRAEAGIAAGQYRHPAMSRLKTEDLQAAHALVDRVAAAFSPLTSLEEGSGAYPLKILARAHIAVARAVAQAPAEVEEAGDTPAAPLWKGEAGAAASRLFAAMEREAAAELVVPLAEYPGLFRALAQTETIPGRLSPHPRLCLAEPGEAKLRAWDVAVLGGLNEGGWPAAAAPGPWLTPAMRKRLGLPQPEERTGAEAAAFAACLLANRRVYLTRAGKTGGVPATASRWLLRLKTLATALAENGKLDRGERWLAWARAHDQVEKRTVLTPPEPRPPVAARPRNLSVTAVEQWIANPYALFASRILRLEPLDPLGAPPDARVRGSILHSALAAFAKAYPDALPGNIADALFQLFPPRDEMPGGVRAAVFWRPRFIRFARWFAKTEPQRRQPGQRVLAEVSGKLVLPAPAGPFVLTGRADRIDIGAAGTTITDYKAGGNLQTLVRSAQNGFAVQLLLEAAIAAAGGFGGIPPAAPQALRYISVSGGEPAGEEWLIGADPADLAGRALAGLEKLIALYDKVETPYRATQRAGFHYPPGGYDHLARTAEWAGTEQEE